MEPDCAVCIFAKPPLPGLAKTRLATDLGPARAAALARAFLEDTLSLVGDLGWAYPILATTDPVRPGVAVPSGVEVWDQGAGDLGERLERVVGRALEGCRAAIAIGADSPGLPRSLLGQAVQALHSTDAVLGPADDGGFYLLGLRACPTGLLAGIPWSTPETCSATRRRLADTRLSVHELEPWFDVDVPDDLDRLRRLLDEGAMTAPATQTLLRSWP